MSASPRTSLRARGWLAWVLLCVGCNSLFGIEEPQHRDESCGSDCPTAGSGGGVSGAGGSSGSAGVSGSSGESGASEAGSAGAGAVGGSCGDGQLDPGEGCDDDNPDAGDGCTACAIDDGYSCDNTHNPSVCKDIDECQSTTPPCPPTYACTNSEGSFTCTCPAGTETCGDACVNKQTDAKNCGTCGTVCAESCSVGRCQLTLASNQPNVFAFAIDASNAYWVNHDADSYVNVMKVSLGGGAPGTLSSKFVGDHNPTNIAVTSSDIYWSILWGQDGMVNRCSLSGGASANVSLCGCNPNSIVVGEISLYYSTLNSPFIMKSPVTGSVATKFMTATWNVNRLALDAANIYWTESDSTTGAVTKGPLNGSAPIPLAENQAGAYGIAIDTTTVYWTNRTATGSVLKVSRNGGTTTPLATAQNLPTGIAIDATYAYWANAGAGTVMKVSLASGTPVTIGSGFTNPTEIAIDATSVYVLSGNDTNTITKITPK